LSQLLTGYKPGGIDELARRQVEIDEGEVEIWIGVQRRRREANFDLVFEVRARCAFDLIQPEVIGPEPPPGPVVTAGVVERHVGLELTGPRQEVRFIDPVFDDPSELGVARAPTPGLPHTGRSKSV